MRRLLIVFVFALLSLAGETAFAQARPTSSKLREVLDLYEKFTSVDQRLEHYDKHVQQLEKDLGRFLESESPLNQLIGRAIQLGTWKISILETGEAIQEEDSIITELVRASTGLTGEAARHADEGIRLLREQHVYLQRELRLTEGSTNRLTEIFRSIKEDNLDKLEELLQNQRLDSDFKELSELDQKRELIFVQAKDAFTRLRAALK